MSYTISITSDAEAFAAEAGRFLAAELEREQLARVLDGVLQGRYAEHVQPVRERAWRRQGELVAVAMRTPPHSLMCTRLPESAASLATELIDGWLARDPDVVGCRRRARDRAGDRRRVDASDRRREPPGGPHGDARGDGDRRPAATGRGRLRPAAVGERDRLVRWWRAFYAEAEPLASRRRRAGRRGPLRRSRSLYVWEDGGEPVSLICGAADRQRLRVDRAGVHAAGAPPSRLRRCRRRRGQPSAARRGLRHGACCSPTSTTRPRTRSTTRSATGGSPTWEHHRFTPPR